MGKGGGGGGGAERGGWWYGMRRFRVVVGDCGGVAECLAFGTRRFNGMGILGVLVVDAVRGTQVGASRDVSFKTLFGHGMVMISSVSSVSNTLSYFVFTSMVLIAREMLRISISAPGSRPC